MSFNSQIETIKRLLIIYHKRGKICWAKTLAFFMVFKSTAKVFLVNIIKRLSLIIPHFWPRQCETISQKLQWG